MRSKAGKERRGGGEDKVLLQEGEAGMAAARGGGTDSPKRGKFGPSSTTFPLLPLLKCQEWGETTVGGGTAKPW